MSKNVSQLDDAGYLIGEVEAEESPLEEGVFLLPRWSCRCWLVSNT